MSDTTVGTRIRMLREAKSLARLEVQRLTGVSEATIARAEVGGVVTRRTAERLAPALGVLVADLLPADGEAAGHGRAAS
jgi:transcriptional regulator with XRE-family HTH domain